MELFDTDALTELSSMLDSLNVTRENASMSSSNSTLYGTSLDPLLEGPGIWSPNAHNSSGISYGSPPADRSFDGSNLWSPNFHNNSYLCGSPPTDKQASEGANGSNAAWSPSSPINNNSPTNNSNSSNSNSSSSYSYPSSPISAAPGLGLLNNVGNNNNAPLSAKQTLQCLTFIRELQEQSQNNNQWDINRANETANLTSALQQHLLAHLLKQQPPASMPNTPSYNNNNNNNNNNSGRYSNGNNNYQNGRDYKTVHENLARNVRYHREAVVGTNEAKCTWSGQLPARNHKNPVYSCKVFLGGVPFEVTMASLLHTFRAYGNVKIEWPGKEDNPPDPKGYAYLIYENERQVKALLQNCIYQYGKEGNWYYKITSKRMRFNSKDVQVIPWALCDSNYVRCQTTKLDPQKTIFVGALHGMINAEGLALIMQELFGGVIYAGIDTDRNKYPIGSARVTFNNHNSYMKAVSAAFVEIRTSKFTKKVQVDPYLEDATCSVCALQQGPYFCRDLSCFRYFCRTCFEIQHSVEPFQAHRPLMRNASRQQRSHSSTSSSSGGSSSSAAPGSVNY